MKKHLFIFFLLSFLPIFSQTLGSNVDKKTLALGEIGTMKIAIFDLGGKKVTAKPKNELLPFHFEEVKDSIAADRDTYERIIEFAVYEEGKFTIPPLDFKIDNEVYHTVPYEIEVINTSQKTDKINDIMNNKEIPLDMVDYWEIFKWYLLGFLALVGLIFAIYKIVKYGRYRRSAPIVATNRTLKELDQLKKKKYIENGNFRLFYVELIDITRSFLTTQYGVPANVLLTDDLIDHLKQSNTISIENEKVVEDVFLRGDLVKFAKTFPTQEAMQHDFDQIRAMVKRSVKDVEFENLRKDV